MKKSFQIYLTIFVILANLCICNEISAGNTASEDYHHLAMIELQESRAEEALEYFKKSFAADPQNAEYRLWLARSLIWNRFYNEGIGHLRHLQSQNYKPGDVLLLKGQASFWSGNPSLALPELDQAIEQGFDSAELFLTRGEVLIALASFSQALAAFAKAEQKLGDDAKTPDLLKDINSSINKIFKNRALCHSYMADDTEAETELRAFNARFPEELDVIIELSRVLRRNGKLEQALSLLQESLTKLPENSALLFEIADSHIKTGQWHQTRNFYERGIELASVTAEIELRWANRLAQIRNFPQAAEIMQRLLPDAAGKTGVKIELAWTFASMERYEEAEGMLLAVLADEPANQQAKLTLARIKLLEKKYDEARELSLQVLQHSESSDAKQILREVEAFYQNLSLDYRESRHERIAELELRVDKEPENFPAVFELVQELANQKQFDRALCHLNRLLCIYPRHYAAWLMRARILGWSQNFCCSLCNYEAMTCHDPENPVYYREAGRTAFWANEIKLALELYQKFLENPVYNRLHAALAPHNAESKNLSDELEKLIRTSQKPAYQRFEEFAHWFANARTQLEPGIACEIDEVLRALHSSWLLQRHFYLESQGKLLNQQRKPRRALNTFNRLIETEPANLEVLFDRSQIFCSLGMLDNERNTYNRILRYAPDHNLIRDALKKLDDDERPLLRFRYHSQQEKGRGTLATMRMHGSRLEALAYLNSRWRATIAGSTRYYRPGIWQGRFRSFESELSLAGVLSASTRLNAGLRDNRFVANRMPQQLSPRSRSSGFIDLTHSFNDRLELTLGFSRSEAYSNDVALRDGIMLDNSFIAVKYPFSRKFVLGAKLEDGRYSDANRLRVFSLNAQYDLTEFPEIFRLILSGERRHTEHTSRYAFLNGNLIDIRHPYWTPQNYRGHNLALQYYRDMSKIRIGRADKHYFSAIVSLGNDSIDNPGRRLDWQWHLDWNNRWEAELGGYWHDSDDWKSHRLNFYIGYRL
ncbi:MAG: hypothetical protein CVV42_04925 [Candidatus Riflebacteria bacterium HGW-Riflebacteria-2]|jgi:tetratricopeptide (TPR) repeat protein|nr:MAG: hypothetical protein CVV42_04925 [Candidatus Riflebacteria bacterium HGW-Riflebacteria-2]